MVMSELATVKNRQAVAPGLTTGGLLQRKCAACGNHTMAGGECPKCENKSRGGLQRKSVESDHGGDAPPIVYEVLNSPGQPLDAGTRSFMEPRFGRDFSQVRVHTDARAAKSARAVNALAYTVGRDVVFDAGIYEPLTTSGQKVLAHELTHVIQQTRNNITGLNNSLRGGAAGDVHEREAEAQADKVVSRGKEAPVPTRLSTSEPAIQRLGDLTRVPPDLPCAPANNSPASVVDQIRFDNRVTALT